MKIDLNVMRIADRSFEGNDKKQVNRQAFMCIDADPQSKFDSFIEFIYMTEKMDKPEQYIGKKITFDVSDFKRGMTGRLELKGTILKVH